QTPEFKRSPQHINIPARTATAHKNLLKKFDDALISHLQGVYNCTTYHDIQTDNVELSDCVGIIASGVAHAYATEIITHNELSDKVELLKIAIINPFPSGEVLQFLRNGFRKILILEELDPIVENEVRILSQRNGLDLMILGKEFSCLSRVGEYNLDIVGQAIEAFTGFPVERKVGLPAQDVETFLKGLPPRPPALCPGCPHRGTFYALKLALGKDHASSVLCGDIGCFALGAFPPFRLMDTIHHMGMSVSMAQGLSEALRKKDSDEKEKIVALVGDGTVFHSSIPSLINAVYTKANITVIIFDNRTIGMTGQQYNPGTIQFEGNIPINLHELLKGIGIQHIETVDPNDVAQSVNAILDALKYQLVAVVIAKSPCVFLGEFKDIVNIRSKVVVDQTICNVCRNQEDLEIFCSREYSAETDLHKARAKVLAENHLVANEQLCPANICNHGFFNAILTGNYAEALNIVHDKMLFARVCGDICPKPCEFMYLKADQPSVPIRKMKQFVAGIDQNSNDFSMQKTHAISVEKLNLSIAVIGAGPAGLSAAYDLIRAGYDVTVFEKESEAGGLLKFAIPDFRIDKDGCDTEIAILAELGVEFIFNRSLGKELEIAKLAVEFDGVIVAIGMGISVILAEIENNVPPEYKYNAIEFLREYNQGTLQLKPDSTVFVIGGGNSAIDAARVAKKFGSDVVIIYRRTREEMPAFEEDIEAALSEGVDIIHNRVIESCRISADGRISVTVQPFKGDDQSTKHQCDYIITAVGQSGDPQSLDPDILSLDESMRIVADPENGKTEYKNVFVAGDICSGNHVSVIGAIASGKKAATGIRQLLEGYTFSYEGSYALDTLSSKSRMKMKYSPHEVSRFDESTIQETASHFELFQECGKCNHCIDNFGCPALVRVGDKVMIDEFQCNSCGQCIDVCLNNAIHYV
ncbi:MAG: FAD-dependent oxidoreductase, partial [Candidatus Electryoneaceae bacterium]|nr:FAD-dependent oxidoreductase [Candidatus Electryoneaceae bacterium]